MAEPEFYEEEELIDSVTLDCAYCRNELILIRARRIEQIAPGIFRPDHNVYATCPHCDLLKVPSKSELNLGDKSYYCPRSGIHWPHIDEFKVCPLCLEATRPTGVSPDQEIDGEPVHRLANFARLGWWLIENPEKWEQWTNESRAD